jgi:dihydrodipicolinate synthase/N-acetylneuraminate lyase
MADAPNEAAKISIQMGDVSLSAEGSETFVREAMTMWDGLANVASQSLDHGAGVVPEASNGQPPALARDPANGTAQYENVYDEVDGRLKLIAHMSGTSKADKTRNVALVELYGH